jgi:hypothetical protein
MEVQKTNGKGQKVNGKGAVPAMTKEQLKKAQEKTKKDEQRKLEQAHAEKIEKAFQRFLDLPKGTVIKIYDPGKEGWTTGAVYKVIPKERAFVVFSKDGRTWLCTQRKARVGYWKYQLNGGAKVDFSKEEVEKLEEYFQKKVELYRGKAEEQKKKEAEKQAKRAKKVEQQKKREAGQKKMQAIVREGKKSLEQSSKSAA